MKRIPMVCLFLIVAATAAANPVVCTFGDLERTIEVVYSDPGQPVPCEVIYDKSGEGSIETLWRANVEANYCETQAAGLIDRLTGLGWACGTPTTDPEPTEALEP
jgi:hypothetical protein